MMNIHLKNYLNSFSFRKKFWQVFLADVLSIGLIGWLWFALGNFLNEKAFAISGGRSVEELKALMLSGTLNSSEAMLANVKSFAYLFLVGGIVALILTLLIYSLSRMVVWDKILRNKVSWRKFPRWVGLSILLFFFTMLYLIFYGILRVGFNLVTAYMSENIYSFILQLIDFAFFMVLIILVFTINYSFTKTAKVWNSFSYAFEVVKKRGARLSGQFIFIYLTGVLVGLIVSYFQRYFFKYPDWVYQAISIGMILFYFSWTRKYVLKGVISYNKHE